MKADTLTTIKIKKHQGNTGCSKDGDLIKEYGNGVIIKTTIIWN